ncbi:cupin domain-containing protein [Limisalsivibrio acetivorans]|uniref:cupin domain-containing protein n=1 Tax=Limisalsivibrio acetivorans TaxID=1304888 RepID=UPI0003B68C0B|nr:cupin domain-containing protein [Limisalsivibrio acetivorans]
MKYFNSIESLPEKRIGEGLYARFLHLDNMTISFWRIEAGTALLKHSHPHEQTTKLLSGEFIMSVGGQEKQLSVDDSVIIPANVEHGGSALSDCMLMDVFTPVREDYKEL